MKYKFVDGSTFKLAGIASYRNHPNSHESHERKETFSFNFDFPNFDFDIDKEAFQREKDRIKEEARRFKEKVKQHTEQSRQNEESSTDQKNEEDEFSRVMSQFGEQMAQFGQSMGQFGKEIGKSFGAFSKDFSKNIDVFTKEFSKIFEAMEKEINSHWESNFNSEDYSLWELESLFNELYENNISLQQVDTSPHLYYEVQCYDLGTKFHDQLTFLGCHVKDYDTLPYSVVTQQLAPKYWLLVKMTEEEFSKDWMKKIEEIDIIERYTIEPYFILRHHKDKTVASEKLHKIYIPLRDK